MPDFKINITGDASSAVQAAQQTASALGNAADETARYEATLRQMEIASRAAEQAQRNLAAAAAASSDESARYQNALEEMAGRGGPEKSRALNPFGDGWMAGMAERRAALKAEGDAGKAAMESVAKATGRVNAAKQELRQLLGALGRAFQGLGAIARAAMDPLKLGVTLFGMALYKLRGNIQDVSDAIQDTPWEGWSIRAQKAAGAVAEIRDMAREAEEASARLMDVFNARSSAEEKMDAARKRVELAQARSIEDPAKRARAEAEIEGRYARRELEREERGRNFKITEQERRAAELQDKENRLGGQLFGARARQQELGTEKDIQHRIDKITGMLDATKADRDAAEKKYAEKYEGFSGFMNDGIIGGHLFGKRDLIKQIEEKQSAEMQLRGMLSREKAKLPEAQRLDAWINSADETYKGMQRSRGGIEAMLPTQRAVAAIETQAGRGAFALENQERAINARNEAQAEAQKLLNELVGAIEKRSRIDEVVSRRLQSWQDRMDALERGMNQKVGGLRH